MSHSILDHYDIIDSEVDPLVSLCPHCSHPLDPYEDDDCENCGKNLWRQPRETRQA